MCTSQGAKVKAVWNQTALTLALSECIVEYTS